MKKSSPGSSVKSKVGTPAAALQRRVVISTAVSSSKQSPGTVAGIRRTSSGRELHDQLRKSSTVSSNGSTGVILNAAAGSNGTLSTRDEDAELKHYTAPVPSPLQATKLEPLVPELSLVIEEKENEPDISASRTDVFPSLPQLNPTSSKQALPFQGYFLTENRDNIPSSPYVPPSMITPERQPSRNFPFASFNVNALSAQKSPNAPTNLVNPLRFDATFSSPLEHLPVVPPLTYSFSTPSSTMISPRPIRIPMDETSYLVQRLQVQDEEVALLHSQLQCYVAAYNDLIEKTRSSRIVCHTASQTDHADSKEVGIMTDAVVFSARLSEESNSQNQKTNKAEDTPHQLALAVNSRNDKVLLPPVDPHVEHYPSLYPEGDGMIFPGRSSEVSIVCNQIAAKYLGPDVGGPRFASAASSSRAWPMNAGNPEAEIWASGVSIATRNYLERHRLVGNRQNGPRGGNLAGESIIEQYDEENYEKNYQEVRHVQEVRTDGYLETDQGRMAIRQTQRNQTVLRSPKKMGDAAQFQDGRREKRASERANFNLENIKNLPKLLPKRN